jgi:hypothetical protein
MRIVGSIGADITTTVKKVKQFHYRPGEAQRIPEG